MNTLVNTLSPLELDHLFNDPPEPPTLPADRWSYHNGRRWKKETQGRSDRRERRRYRETITFWFRCQAGEFDGEFQEIEFKAMSAHTVSLYDWIMNGGKL